MSSNKYADLPDIDTAPDVYETEDVVPSAQTLDADGSDDEAVSRPSGRTRQEGSGKEELDTARMISPEEASRKFRKAEKRRGETRVLYSYPDSEDEQASRATSSKGASKPAPLSQRLRSLQAELSSLEHELSDPSNPLLQKETEETDVDPGELIRGLVDVRSRLDKIVKEKEGRARLVGNILHEDKAGAKEHTKETTVPGDKASPKPEAGKTVVKSLVDVDRRVEELERLIGSSNAGLDDTSPLPPPLLPMITKLNSQLALLTQPRHIDSISRRLKLLLSDLERAAAAQQHRRQGSHGNEHTIGGANHEQLLTIVNRIAPSLPQIPHILSHLRTLSTLHSAAGEFQDTLKDLEKEQQKIHGGLLELQNAVETVEKSLEENRTVVKENVSGLDGRVNDLLKRLEDIKRDNAA